MWFLKQIELVASQLRLCILAQGSTYEHHEDRDHFVLLMTHFLTQSIYCINTFLKNILSCWNYCKRKRNNFSPTEVTKNDKERKRFSSVQSLSRVWLFPTPWIAARQASLSITNSRSPPKLMSIESVMSSSHLILCRPLLFLLSIFPSIRVFSNESVLRIRWPEYWSFSFSISPSKEHPGLISFRMDWLDLLAV